MKTSQTEVKQQQIKPAAEQLIVDAEYANTPEFKALKKLIDEKAAIKNIEQHVKPVIDYLNKRLNKKYEGIEDVITAINTKKIKRGGGTGTKKRKSKEDEKALLQHMTEGRSNAEIRKLMPHLSYNQVNNFRKNSFAPKA